MGDRVVRRYKDSKLLRRSPMCGGERLPPIALVSCYVVWCAEEALTPALSRRTGRGRNANAMVGARSPDDVRDVRAVLAGNLGTSDGTATAPVGARVGAAAFMKLGSAFDQRKFHDAILALGSVPLPVLEQRMAQFIADGGNNPPR